MQWFGLIDSVVSGHGKSARWAFSRLLQVILGARSLACERHMIVMNVAQSAILSSICIVLQRYPRISGALVRRTALIRTVSIPDVFSLTKYY